MRDFISVAPFFCFGERLHITCRRKEPPPSTHRFNKERDIATDGPSLFSCAGTFAERQAALSLLSNWRGSLVLDFATLVEMAACGAIDALRVIPTVLVAQSTLDTLRHLLEYAELENATGTLGIENGQIYFAPITDDQKQRRITLFKKCVEFCTSSCKVLPAYGPENAPEDLHRLRDILDDESLDAIAVAIEQDGCLLTLDLRLRSLAATFGVPGVWPQAVMMHAKARGQFSDTAYASSAFWLLGGGRSHVALTSDEILWVLQQFSPTMQAGLRLLRRHVAQATIDLESVLGVARDLLRRMLVELYVTYGAFMCLLEALASALVQHPRATPDRVGAEMRGAVIACLDALFGPSEQSYFASAAARTRRQVVTELLFAGIDRGLGKSIPVDAPIGVEGAFYLRKPLLTTPSRTPESSSLLLVDSGGK